MDGRELRTRGTPKRCSVNPRTVKNGEDKPETGLAPYSQRGSLLLCSTTFPSARTLLQHGICFLTTKKKIPCVLVAGVFVVVVHEPHVLLDWAFGQALPRKGRGKH